MVVQETKPRRKYELKVRAERERETRRRIVQAAVDLAHAKRDDQRRHRASSERDEETAGSVFSITFGPFVGGREVRPSPLHRRYARGSGSPTWLNHPVRAGMTRHG